MEYLIIEDEYHAAKRLRLLMEKHFPDSRCITVIDSVEDATIWFTENKSPDLAFFDIQLADGLSFNIFNNAQVDVPVIFTTAFDEYALRAFKANSVDYLLKPIDETELVTAVEKYKKLFGQPQSSIDQDMIKSLMRRLSTPEYVKRFLIKQGTSLTYINTDQIAYFFSQDGLTFLVSKDKHKHSVDFTLEQLEDSVDPAGFFRINRKLIVSVQSVNKISSYFNNRLKLTLSPSVVDDAIVSRDKVKKFKVWMTGVT